MTGILGIDSIPVPHTMYLASMVCTVSPKFVVTRQRVMSSCQVAAVTSVLKRKYFVTSSFLAAHSRYRKISGWEGNFSVHVHSCCSVGEKEYE